MQRYGKMNVGAIRVLPLLIALLVFSTNTLGATAQGPAPTTPVTPSSARDVSSKIDRALLGELQSGKSSRALIVLSEQADLSGADALRTKEEKGAFVFNALRAVANRTQANLRATLTQRGVNYRAFYIVNAIAVEQLDFNLASRLAAEPSVARIVADPNVRVDLPRGTPESAQAPKSPTWGIQKIGADKLWALGIRGKGIVVANQDTGVDWTHPALQKRYRGYNPKTHAVDHSYNWWDAIHTSITGNDNPCGLNLTAPCDDFGHGTYTMGTMVGRQGKQNEIGVAPRAKWISCRNMDEGVGRPTTYMECFEFFLAPWDARGNNPDPTRAPDVVNNSWGCPKSELCDPDSLQQATRALRAAGIFDVVAAGNSGWQCRTVNEPAEIYAAATTIGATDTDDLLAGFSSRGPVTVDGSNRRKPDLSAPGVDVRSSIPGGKYISLSGTSAAAPHVTGAVALLWQAKPNLRGSIGKTEQVLFQTANPHVTPDPNPDQPCGGTTAADIPNNLFGFGRLDVWKAYKQAQ